MTKSQKKPKQPKAAAPSASSKAGKSEEKPAASNSGTAEQGEDSEREAPDPRKNDNPLIAELMADSIIPGEGFETKVQYKKQSKRNAIVALFYKPLEGKLQQKVQIVCKDDRYPAWVAMLLLKRIQIELIKGRVDLLHLKTRKEELMADYDDGELLNRLQQWQDDAGPEAMYGDIAAVLRAEADSLPVKQKIPANLRRSDQHIPEVPDGPPGGDRDDEAPKPAPVLGNPDTCETLVIAETQLE